MSEFTTVFLFLDDANGIISEDQSQVLFGCLALFFGIAQIFLAFRQKAGCTTLFISTALIFLSFKQRIPLPRLTSPTKGLKNVKIRPLFVGAFLIYWSVLWLALSGSIYLSSSQKYNHLLEIYYEGKYKIAEGFVQVIHAKTAQERGGWDTVRIGSDEFQIKDHVASLGYNKVIINGGVLAEGAYVRVYHYDGEILRIDLLRKR